MSFYPTLRKIIYLALFLLPNWGYSQGIIIPEKAEIDEIVFQGNANFPDRQLLDQLSIHEKFLIRKGSPYNKRQLVREDLILANYYRQYGYLDVTVVDLVTHVTGKNIRVEFQINEGKQYYLEHFTIAGNSIIPDSEYERRLTLRTGIPFSRYTIQNGIQQIVRQYETIGYPYVVIRDSVAVHDSVDFFLRVHEGPLTHIGEVEVPPQPGIKPEIIKREIVIKRGDIYNIDLIEETQRRLFETRLFNGVLISPVSRDTLTPTVDLKIQLIVSKFRSVDFDFGLTQQSIATYTDPLLNLKLAGGWRHKNLGNVGRQFQVRISASTRFPEIYQPQKFRGDLLYTEPWLLNFRTPTTINPFYEYVDWSDVYGAGAYSRQYGLTIYTIYRWFRSIQARAELEWSKGKYKGITKAEDKPTEQRIFRLNTTWDKRNNYFTPSSGYLLQVNPTLMGTFLGGDHHLIQVESSYSVYHRLFWNVIGAARIGAGITAFFAQDTSRSVPLNQRFYLGGNASVRGYKNQLLGPTMIVDGQLIPLGGNFKVYGNFEVRFPIYWIVGGELFVDWGNLWSQTKYANLSDIKVASGFGITFATPIGPARIDFGWPLNDVKYGTNWNIHVAIAYAF